MSYLQQNFIPGRGAKNNHAAPDQLAIHLYYSSTDNAADIYLDQTYFPPYFGFDAEMIKPGDILYISGANQDAAFKLASVTNFAYFASQATPTLINSLKIINRPLVVTGSTYLPPDNNTQVLIQAINTQVTATFPQFIKTLSANSIITIPDVFPAPYKPSQDLYRPVMVSNGSATFGRAAYSASANTLTIQPVSSLGPTPGLPYGYYTFTIDFLMDFYTDVN